MPTPTYQSALKSPSELIVARFQEAPDLADVTVSFAKELGGVSLIAPKVDRTVRDNLRSAFYGATTFENIGGPTLSDPLVAFDMLRVLTRSPVMKSSPVSIPAGLFNSLSERLDAAIEAVGPEGLRPFFRIKQVTPSIFDFRCESRALLCATMLRPQEHVDGREFRGKFFSRAEFKDWYRTEESPLCKYADAQGQPLQEFTYYSDWSGFNFPDRVARALMDGSFGSLTKAEQFVADTLAALKSDGPYYVIGSSGKDSDPLALEVHDHEVRHGLYHTNPDYRAAVEALLDREDVKPVLPTLFEYFKGDGCYHPDVWRDEAQAHLGNGAEFLLGRIPLTPTDLRIHAVAQQEILEISRQYLEK
ncbi:MAG: hypothetical protein J0M12_10575 [Deltaproteobacteria bacterium]|nr:hypothetical protein [Deltaproteobacteria bacterium]